jgi:ergothioneine biosynthesis protein EgtB
MTKARNSITIRSAPADKSLAEKYARIRALTQSLCATLTPEDTVVQSMPETSPVKWHLAHTTWFFEQFVLLPSPGYRPLHPQWSELFNSYYHSVGAQFARSQRGLLSRPTLAEVLSYRERVDQYMHALLQREVSDELLETIVLGLNHEQQHQELILTDLKHLLSINPLEPVYRGASEKSANTVPGPLRFIQGREGIVEIGHNGSGFAFDNEAPRHSVLQYPHSIAHRPVNNDEFIDFILDGGYRNPLLWMAEGWSAVQQHGWQRPLYWSDDLASAFTLSGRQPIDPLAPVCHVSFYESDAYARWAGARLPTEAEWETLAADLPVNNGIFLESGALQPRQPADGFGALQLFGDVWEWTSSPYVNYPSFRAPPGALGEYNAKFMCGQWVLRGGSCVTPAGHVRPSYRNFFYPADRWQFSGLRLARDT